MRQWERVLGRAAVAGALGLGLTGAAHANAGTAMVVLGLGHLVFGNLLIGLLEWLVLRLLVRRRAPLNAAGGLHVVLGNYFSAAVGFFLLAVVWPAVVSEWAPQPLLQARGIILVSWAVLFVLSVLLERWFVHRAMTPEGGREPSFGRSLAAAFAVNLVSYALLTAFYFQICPAGLATRVSWVAPASIASETRATSYFLGRGGSICRIRLDGTGAAQVLPPQPGRRETDFWLGVDPATGRLALREDQGLKPARPLLADVGRAPVFPAGDRQRPTYEHPWQNWWAQDLRPANAPRGEVSLGFSASEGIRFRPPGGASVRLALETPFLSYSARHGTVLDRDLLVCELVRAANQTARETGQLVVIDLRRHLIALLAEGSAPVVVLDDLPQGAQWYQPHPPPPD